jgi:hypothetical protein
MPVVCGADGLPAFAAGGVRLSCCNAITITAPQAAPTSHETMTAFVNLHHIVASTGMASGHMGFWVNALWTIWFHPA